MSRVTYKDLSAAYIAKMDGAVAFGLQRAGQELAGAMKRKIQSRGGGWGAGGGVPSRPGESPTTQLGLLRNSIQLLTPGPNSRVVYVGSNQKYARSLELGRRGSPRGVVPLNKDAAAMLRQGSIRGRSDLFPIRSPSGKLLLAEKQLGKRGTPVKGRHGWGVGGLRLMFKIGSGPAAPRPFMRPAVKESAGAMLSAFVDGAARKLGQTARVSLGGAR